LGVIPQATHLASHALEQFAWRKHHGLQFTRSAVCTPCTRMPSQMCLLLNASLCQPTPQRLFNERFNTVSTAWALTYALTAAFNAKFRDIAIFRFCKCQA